MTVACVVHGEELVNIFIK